MSRDFTTKPRPDQPGRCPSIDPHDTLQCTRAIHDDDQCQAGGIAWRKGSPRIEWDRERADRLQEEVEEYDAILIRQGDLLIRTVNALRGNPPPLTSWSHHDIPELAAEKVAEVARLTAERDALAAGRCMADTTLRDEEHRLVLCVLPEGHRIAHDDLLGTSWTDGTHYDPSEVERLRETVARVEALAEEWRYKGQFGWGPWQLGEGPDPEGYVMDYCASALRAALAGVEADTTDQEADRG